MFDNNQTPQVAVLGPLGTYSHEAATLVFGSTAIYKEQKSIANVFSVLSPSLPFGVIPQENSIYGGVVETYDLLRDAGTTFIQGEVTLKVEHCLLVKSGTKLHQISKIMSHEQALGQCRRFIELNFPGIKVVKTTSTAAAAKALEDAPPDCAAICSSICASLFTGLEILARGVQEKKSNFTRFYIITHSPTTTLNCHLEPQHQMKGLFRVCLSTLHSRDITRYLVALNLPVTRIDRRPSLEGAPFDSFYFIEVQRDGDDCCEGSPFESWSNAVRNASSRVNEDGWESAIIGIW